MSDATTERETTEVATRRRRGPSVRLVVLVVALLPLAGLLVLLLGSVRELDRERRAADSLDHGAMELVELIEARTAVSAEEVASSVIVIGNELGVDPEELSDLFDQDFLAQLGAARDRVDETMGSPQLDPVRPAVDAFLALRERVDAGTVSPRELTAAIGRLTDSIDDLWEERVDAQSRRATASELTASVQLRLIAVTTAYLTLSNGSDRALLTEAVVNGEPTPEQMRRLVDATGAFERAAVLLPERLGPRGLAAWRAHLTEPAAQRFEAVLDDTIEAVVAGQPPPLAGDPVAFGDAFIDGPEWAAGLRATVEGAADDLRNEAAAKADSAQRDLQVRILLTGLLTVASLAVALLAARAVSAPLRRLEEAANLVHEGRFDLPDLDEAGPRELADTARAFNEMTSTLTAVEAHAVALADDPDARILTEPLPGRTGRALQVALNRLRASIQVAEQRRRDLEKAATHDGLTGLLNRAAAFEVLGRDLLRSERGGGPVVALFIDIDGLKPINDQHGHSAGDDALRLTARALRDATRASDVVARLGGDEFLVAGVLPSGGSESEVEAEAEALAQRVLDQVRQQAVAVEGTRIPLRCSVGIAVSDPGTTAEALVNEADAALLEAKRSGKDRMGWYSGRPRRRAGCQ